jgi:hypothetical protein
MEQEFYQRLAQRVRVIAEKADPFTRRRLLDLAKRYDAKGSPTSRSGSTERPLPTPRTAPPEGVPAVRQADESCVRGSFRTAAAVHLHQLQR